MVVCWSLFFNLNIMSSQNTHRNHCLKLHFINEQHWPHEYKLPLQEQEQLDAALDPGDVSETILWEELPTAWSRLHKDSWNNLQPSLHPVPLRGDQAWMPTGGWGEEMAETLDLKIKTE